MVASLIQIFKDTLDFSLQAVASQEGKDGLVKASRILALFEEVDAIRSHAVPVESIAPLLLNCIVGGDDDGRAWLVSLGLRQYVA